MEGNESEERIKPCLSCDKLIPYDVDTCPLCQSSQSLEGAKDCPKCSLRLHPKALFCPRCNTLTVVTVQGQFSENAALSSSSRTGVHYEISIFGIALAVIIFQAWIIVDYLFLS